MAVFEDHPASTSAFEDLESSVRTYCRGWPVVFDRARGSWLFDERGKPYLDFFAGAGTLNYGHNNPLLRESLVEYLCSERVVHSLDMFTSAKRDFLIALDEVVLRPRGLRYRVQFPGPAGTNAVEAALKLARKVTGRTNVICFTGAFHGTTLGSLTVTANSLHRRAAGVPLEHTTMVPFDPGAGEKDLAVLDLLLEDDRARPAAVIVEAVQGEGGVNVASAGWLRGLAERCRRNDVPLILDEIQMGCGRTGPFFSFEHAGIEPDFVCLSKSISGYGLPLALTLIRPDLDVWEPGEHNGTFRGFNPAFVTGARALRTYWQDEALELRSRAAGSRTGLALREIARSAGDGAVGVRGVGMVHGLVFPDGEQARRVAARAFELGLLVERAGSQDEVVKLMPPLTVSDDELDRGLAILAEAVAGSG